MMAIVPATQVAKSKHYYLPVSVCTLNRTIQDVSWKAKLHVLKLTLLLHSDRWRYPLHRPQIALKKHPVRCRLFFCNTVVKTGTAFIVFCPHSFKFVLTIALWFPDDVLSSVDVSTWNRQYLCQITIKIIYFFKYLKELNKKALK